MQQYSIKVSGSAPTLFPADTFFGLLYYSRDEALEIPKRYPFSGEWGQVLSTHLLDDDNCPMPRVLDIVWLSIVERKFYSKQCRLPFNAMEKLWEEKDEDTGETRFSHLVVGMAPYGGIAIWMHGETKSILIGWLHGEEIKVDMKDFMPMNPTVTLDENCDFYINSDSRVKENLEKNGLPPRHLYDKYMQQFTYRYLPLFEHWDEDKHEWTKYSDEETSPEFDYIDEALFDGTHDKLHDGGLMNYHEAGKPKKLAVQWHIKKSEYTAYFWFEDEEIRAVFDRFYGTHPETKTDLMIRIDTEKKKFELALYRYGLKEPQVISESAYQLIVFKNKFEYYKSENYAQEKGAWIW